MPLPIEHVVLKQSVSRDWLNGKQFSVISACPIAQADGTGVGPEDLSASGGTYWGVYVVNNFKKSFPMDS